MKDKVLIWLYKHIPARFYTQAFIDAVGDAADREIARTKRTIIKKRWEKEKLQSKLFELRGNR